MSEVFHPDSGSEFLIKFHDLHLPDEVKLELQQSLHQHMLETLRNLGFPEPTVKIPARDWFGLWVSKLSGLDGYRPMGIKVLTDIPRIDLGGKLSIQFTPSIPR